MNTFLKVIIVISQVLFAVVWGAEFILGRFEAATSIAVMFVGLCVWELTEEVKEMKP